MRVIFVGNRFKLGGLAEAIHSMENSKVVFIEANFNIINQENIILEAAQEAASYIIYDTEQYLIDAEDVVDRVKMIYRATKAKPILYVPTSNPKNTLVKYAVSQDIKYFINSGQPLGVQKDELLKIINNFYEANKREDIKAVEKEVLEETVTLNRFVGELYEAKEREIKKEKTVIIKKKKTVEIIIEVLTGIIKTSASIVSVCFIAIGILAIVYPKPRAAVWEILVETYKDILRLLM